MDSTSPSPFRRVSRLWRRQSGARWAPPKADSISFSPTTTKQGTPWGKSNLSKTLSQVIYLGKIRYRDEVHGGLHDAIVDAKTFESVQEQLKRHGRRGGADGRNKWALLLRGVLHCGRCGSKMAHTYSSKKDRRWHYYLCPTLEIPGSDRCEGHRVPAREIESFVVEKLRETARAPEIILATIRAAHAESERKRPELVAEQRRLGIDLRQVGDERRNLVTAIAKAGPAASALVERLGGIDDRERHLQARRAEVQSLLEQLDGDALCEDEVRAALLDFEGVWAALLPREQQRLVRLLIARVSFHADTGEVDIEFRPGGIKTIAEGRNR